MTKQTVAYTEKSSPEKKCCRRWPFWLAGILSILCVLIIFLLPYVLRVQATKLLQAQGATTASIKRVRFNLFTGKLAIESLGARKADVRRLRVRKAALNAEWLSLFQKRIQLKNVFFSNAEIDIERLDDGSLLVGGLTFVPQTKSLEYKSEAGPTGAWGFGIEALDLENIILCYSDSLVETDIFVHKLHIDQLASWLPDTPAPFSADLELNGGRLSLAGMINPFARTITVKSAVKSSKIKTKRLAKSLQQMGIENIGARLSTDADISAHIGRDGQHFDVSLNGLMTLAGIHGKTPTWELSDGTVYWNGRIQVKRELGQFKAKADGNLELIELAGHFNEPPNYQLFGKEIAWQGLFELEQVAAATPPHATSGPDLAAKNNAKGRTIIKGTLSAEKLSVTDPKKKLTVLAFDSLHVTDFYLNDMDSIQAEKIGLANVFGLSEESETEEQAIPDLALSTISLDKVDFEKLTHLNVEKIGLSGLKALVKLDSDGKFEALEILPLSHDQAQTESSPKTGNFSFHIGTIELTGDNSLALRDRSVQPPFSYAFRPITMQIENLDTTESQTKTTLKLMAKSGQHESVNFNGFIQPFADRLSTNIQGKIKSVNLASLSSYAEKLAGHTLKSGVLDANLSVRIDKGILDSEAKLIFNKLNMKPLKPEDADKFSKDIGIEVPIETALSLLRDKDDIIRLTLPIQGDIQDPNIRIGDAVRKAVAKGTVSALKTGVLVYFAPLGAAVMVGKVLGYATALRFNPVVFAPGSAELDQNDLKYLDEMAKLLADRPKTRLLLCGIAVPDDIHFLEEEMRNTAAKQKSSSEALGKNRFLAKYFSQQDKEEPTTAKSSKENNAKASMDLLEEDLRRLGKQRGEAIRDYLVARGIIPQDRLIVCTPEIERKTGGTPRVDISL